jgi:hypothetical protein
VEGLKGFWAPVGWPLHSQLTNQAASPQETSFTGRLAHSEAAL